MQKAYLCPYLMFDGTCEQAMNFYQSCMGGTLKMQRYGETPMPCSDSQKDKIMHASLENDSLSFMAADGQENRKTVQGDNVHLSVAGTDEARLKEMFLRLSAGGAVTMALEKQFWGDTFGMLTDKFGIHWMFNIAGAKSHQQEQSEK